MSSKGMFIGRHDLRVDDKGRLTIPARFKSVLQDNYPGDEMQVVVTLSLDKNLSILPYSEYVKKTEQFESYDAMDEKVRRFQELLTGLASVEKVDSAGRIRISADLRETACIDREVTCIGRTGYFDVWDRERWHDTQSEALRDLKMLTEHVRTVGKEDKARRSDD